MLSDALKKLNQEVMELQRSREYRTGRMIYQLLHFVRHCCIKKIIRFIRAGRKERIIRSFDKPNAAFLSLSTKKEVYTGKLIVYTCITGNYDIPLEPYFIDEQIEYYIVTDMQIPGESVWKKIDINTLPVPSDMDQTRKARYVKTHPHILFPKDRYSVWVDGHIQCISDLREYVPCIGRTGIAAHWHPLRNCIYQEARVCKIKEMDQPSVINRQIRHYLAEGMPEEFGLIESGFLLREHNHPDCIRIMELWWREISRYSKRDQISFPYCIWKQGFTMKDMGFIGTNISRNYSIRIMSHPE